MSIKETVTTAYRKYVRTTYWEGYADGLVAGAALRRSSDGDLFDADGNVIPAAVVALRETLHRLERFLARTNPPA